MAMKLRRILLVGLLAGYGFSLQAETLTLKDGYPSTYRVKKGDTLWDISAHFLRSPWLWPKLWQANPQVANPHLIYPGDLLTLIWVNGQPRLVRESPADKTVHLAPRVRIEPAVPTISFSSIAGFTDSHHMVAPQSMEGAPYILGDEDGREVMVTGSRIYVRGALDEDGVYGVYRPGEVILDRDSDEPLGQRSALVGTLKVTSRQQGMALAEVTSMKQEMRQGDKVLPLSSDESIAVFYYPRPGPVLTQSHVVTMGREGTAAGRNGVVFINKGLREGVQSGDLYSVLKPGPAIYDGSGYHAGQLEYADLASVYQRLTGPAEQLPAKPIARLMVFKVYDKLSAALVLDSEDIVRVGYPVGRVQDAGPGS